VYADATGPESMKPSLPLDRLTWNRWQNAVRSFATSEAGGRAKALFAALLVLLLTINGLNVVNSYVGRDFMTAIQERNMPRFVAQALLYVGVFGASTLAAVIYRFTEERLGLLWREWLTQRLVARYLQNGTYYWLREHADVANPDQRIADDVRTFTATTLSLALVLLNSAFTIVAFSGVMWSISAPLFVVAVLYAALGSGLTVLFGRPLIWLNYSQADREASFRAELVHLREHAESVAVLRREGRLGERLQRRVGDLVENMKRIIAVNRNLGFFTTGYNYLIQIIPVLIVAPLFIRGQAPFGVISQSSMAFSHLLGAFSLIITQFQQISAYAVVVARLSALAEGVERVTARDVPGIEIDDTGTDLAWDHLTLRSPHDGRLLVDDLTLSVPRGMRALVTGPSEAGRIALFRATAGLWHVGEGRIVHPPPDAISFIPERPYLPPGTLRQSLVRTGSEARVGEARILDVLRALGIESVVAQAGGLDVEHDWDNLLSLGEQQQLAFARVVLAAPRFVLLDRPATLLSAEDVARAVALLAADGITSVTFAPDAQLAARHDAQLEVADDGTWTWRPSREESPAHERA
jgi:vitamin B12/bleomycin/antimicrobial peptide transport system ATP-binding/permease protein